MLMPAIINGVTYGATLFLVAVGLSLIFGVLRILNVSHGSFYALGAFSAASAWMLISAAGVSPYLIYPALLVAAIAVGVVLGPIVERLFLRWTFGIRNAADRENIQLLTTYAIFLILENGIKLIWGGQPYYSGGALSLLGISRIGGIVYPNYKLALIVVAIVVLIALRCMLKYTRIGKFIVVVADDPELAQAIGISVNKVYIVTFSVGAALAALGGAAASPTIGVTTGIGADMIVLSFAVVAVAGLGQIEGAAVAALVIGVAHGLAVFYANEITALVPYIIMVAVLLVRPNGLFGATEQRRI